MLVSSGFLTDLILYFFRCVSFFGKIQIAEFCAIIFAVNLNLNYSEEN
jgi:hypothetical protein